MNRDKQIEEMAKLLEKDCGRCYDCDALSKTSVGIACTDYYHAMQLYNAGYRKASEVADKLINTALSKIQIMISAIKAQEKIGNVTEFNGGAKTSLELVFYDLAELKKKYTEDER